MKKSNNPNQLVIINNKLAFQNKKNEKQAIELGIVNTELKKIEEVLRNSLKEVSDYKYALDESSIVAVTDHKGIIKHVNDNFCKISGYSAEEIIGQDHRIINSGYHPKSYIKNLWGTIAKGKIWKGEFCNKAKNGNLYWVDATIIPFLNNKNKPYQYLAIRNDITERKEKEKKLEERDFFLRESQKAGNIGSYKMNFVTGYWQSSETLDHIFGIDNSYERSVAGWVKIVHPDDQQKMDEYLREEVINKKQPFNKEYRIVRINNKQTRWVCGQGDVKFDDKGNIMEMVGTIQDITERKKTETAMRSMEQEILNQHVEEQKKITRAILNAQETERNRIGQELHDNINQILAGTKLYLGMAGAKDEEVRELIKYPMELIDNAISEIRLLSHKQVTPLKDVNLKELIQSILDNLAKTSTLKTNLIYMVTDKAIGDDLKLNIYRIIQEQVNNIMKHAAAKNVNISIKANSKAINIIVADNGKGFNTSIKRNGIGISNMINRVKSFNGEIGIESSPGNGCAVQIKIPYNL